MYFRQDIDRCRKYDITPHACHRRKLERAAQPSRPWLVLVLVLVAGGWWRGAPGTADYRSSSPPPPPPPARPGCCCSSWAGAVTAVQQPVTTTNYSGADTDRGHALAAPGHVRHVLARVSGPSCCPVQLCNVQCASVCTSLTPLPLYLVWSPSVRVLGLVSRFGSLCASAVSVCCEVRISKYVIPSYE